MSDLTFYHSTDIGKKLARPITEKQFLPACEYAMIISCFAKSIEGAWCYLSQIPTELKINKDIFLIFFWTRTKTSAFELLKFNNDMIDTFLENENESEICSLAKTWFYLNFYINSQVALESFNGYFRKGFFADFMVI